MAYFPLAVPAIVDLIQQTYHAQPGLPASFSANTKADHRLGIVIYFCALGEVLLGHFLSQLMRAQEIPAGICDRLLADHLYTRSRVDKLFPSLVGEKWRDAMQAISSSSVDYEKTARFYMNVVDKRNILLHTGNKWAIGPTMAKRCLEHTALLLALFVALHNHFIAPVYEAEDRFYDEPAP